MYTSVAAALCMLCTFLFDDIEVLRYFRFFIVVVAIAFVVMLLLLLLRSDTSIALSYKSISVQRVLSVSVCVLYARIIYK